MHFPLVEIERRGGPLQCASIVYLLCTALWWQIQMRASPLKKLTSIPYPLISSTFHQSDKICCIDLVEAIHQ